MRKNAIKLSADGSIITDNRQGSLLLILTITYIKRSR